MTTTLQERAPERADLVNRAPEGAEREAALERAVKLPRIELDEVGVSDLELLGVGGFSPLTGFVGSADYRSIVEEMHLTNGQPWSIPITLAVGDDQAGALRDGQEIALVELRDELRAEPRSEQESVDALLQPGIASWHALHSC